jgi:endonuclease/exonuclease/phosphatase family metal-dependent hydrolase
MNSKRISRNSEMKLRMFKKKRDKWNKEDSTRYERGATEQYTFSSVAHRTFSKIDHILGHKTTLNKYKKTVTTPWILSDHNTIKLELNNKRSSRKHSNNCGWTTHYSTISGS